MRAVRTIVLLVPSFWLIALLCGVGRGADQNRVEANEFILRDKAGRIRAKLGLSEDESVMFSLRSGDGASMLMLGLSRDGREGVIRVGGDMTSTFSVLLKRDSAVCRLKGPGSGSSFVVGSTGGQWGVQVTDTAGNLSLSFLLDEKRRPSFFIRDEKGRHVFEVP